MAPGGNQGRKFAIVDAGMNDLVRPAMYDAYHEVHLVSRAAEGELEPIDVVGPVCESSCYFARARKMPPLRSGDLLAISDAGAYGSVMASTYNARRIPAEILIETSGEQKLIRGRDSFEDVWRNEV